MKTEIKIWRMFYDKHEIYIRAESFDEAVEKARNINSKFCGGQIVEIENIPINAILIEK